MENHYNPRFIEMNGDSIPVKIDFIDCDIVFSSVPTKDVKFAIYNNTIWLSKGQTKLNCLNFPVRCEGNLDFYMVGPSKFRVFENYVIQQKIKYDDKWIHGKREIAPF